MKRFFICVGLLLACFFGLGLRVSAAPAEEIPAQAALQNISGFQNADIFFDGLFYTGQILPGGSSLTFQNESGIGSLYLIYDIEPGSYQIISNDTGKTLTAGTQDYLHEYIDLCAGFGVAPKSVTIQFDQSVQMGEIRLYSPGEMPADVQVWQTAEPGSVDLLLFSTHGDDEQLFFAGIIPYYAAELGYQVQVAYFTSHRPEVYYRVHEMLNGLWAVGLKNYPTFGPFPDFHSLALADSYAKYSRAGYEKAEMLSYVVSELRKWKPMVAVGHDINGEYGHGAHRMYSELLRQGVEIAAQADQYPESADTWGTWNTPKTYLHLYENNPVVMDWDKPLKAFGGMTAYEVTRDLGFACHRTQLADFSWYYEGADTAAQVDGFSPCFFGLFRSEVGADVMKNDFFENLLTHEAQELLKTRRLALEASMADRKASAEAPTEVTEPPTLQITVEETEPEVSTTAAQAGVGLSAGGLFLLKLKKFFEK